MKCLLIAIAHLIKTGDWQPHVFAHADDYYKTINGRLIHYHIWICKNCGHIEISSMIK